MCLLCVDSTCIYATRKPDASYHFWRLQKFFTLLDNQLIEAHKRGDQEEVKRLLSEGADENKLKYKPNNSIGSNVSKLSEFDELEAWTKKMLKLDNKRRQIQKQLDVASKGTTEYTPEKKITLMNDLVDVVMQISTCSNQINSYNETKLHPAKVSVAK